MDNSKIKELINSYKNENTRKIYLNIFNKIIQSPEYNENKNIEDLEENKLIKIIKSINDNPHLIDVCLFLIIKLKSIHKKPVDKLLLYKRQNSITKANKIRDKNQNLNNNNIKYEDLINYLNKLENNLEINKKLTNIDYRKYIINYLLINYCVRNLDLDLIITNDKSIINGNDNFLFISKNNIQYIRFNYKTFNIYGIKIINITNVKFIDIVKKYLGEEKQKYLLQMDNGEKINKNSYGKIISNHTYQKIGEGKIFKIIIDHYKNDSEMKNKLSYYRGTGINGINDNYTLELI